MVELLGPCAVPFHDWQWHLLSQASGCCCLCHYCWPCFAFAMLNCSCILSVAAMVMRVCSLLGVLHLMIGECLPVVHARKLLCIVGWSPLVLSGWSFHCVCKLTVPFGCCDDRIRACCAAWHSSLSWALFRPCLVRRNFQNSPSYRIFGRMHGALNINKNKN